MGRQNAFPASPKILAFQWGSMNIENLGTGRDMKLWPGGGRPWDWGETGTQHTPGIQIADIEELLDHGSQIIVLTQGVNGRLQVCPETLTYLKEQGADAVVVTTTEGIERYNAYVETGKRVGGVFHSTC